MKEIDAILAEPVPEVEKLRQAFMLVTDRVVTHAEHEVELLRAMNDREGMIKEQIKMSTVKMVQGIFRDCHLRVTGKRSLNE